MMFVLLTAVTVIAGAATVGWVSVLRQALKH
jgi:hypothetical protein